MTPLADKYLSISSWVVCMLARIFEQVLFAFCCCLVHWVAQSKNILAPVACAPVACAWAKKISCNYVLPQPQLWCIGRYMAVESAFHLHLTEIDVKFFRRLFNETCHLILAKKCFSKKSSRNETNQLELTIKSQKRNNSTSLSYWNTITSMSDRMMNKAGSTLMCSVFSQYSLSFFCDILRPK